MKKTIAIPGNKHSVKSSPFYAPVIQPKLAIGAPNDVYEQEADAVANKILNTPGRDSVQAKFFKPAVSAIQRKCAHCEEEEKQMQRKEINSETTMTSNEAESYVGNLNGSGEPLPNDVRSFYEPRFGFDFSDVKVHTDSVAAKSAQSINALAYTSGSNIVFNSGQYSPDTDGGKSLLGHELTHVIQQSGSRIQTKRIQRCPDAATNTQYDGVAAQVRAHAEYIALGPPDRAVADDIITRSRARDDCMHFITRLLDLFNTPTNQSPAVAAAATGFIATGAQAETGWLLPKDVGCKTWKSQWPAPLTCKP
jgi:hypothetical protein